MDFCGESAGLDIESKMHHVALADDVFLSFETQLPGLFRPSLALVRDEIVVGDDFGANESMFEVSMNHARCLRRRRPCTNGPCPHLFDAGGEVGLQPQHRIAAADHAIEGW